MKKLLLFVFTYTLSSSAQNLVRDPSFEDARRMPSKNNNSISCTKNWTSTNGAGDYYHKRGGRHAGVPRNIFGRQKPHSGKAYAGICTRKKFIEYLQTKLSDTLKEGQAYLVELYISRAEHSIGRVKEFGVLFTKGYHWQRDDKGFAEKPSLDFTKRGGFRNKKKWTKLSAVYTSAGGETTLILGYFNYDRSKKLRGIAHYYIDDVSVTPIKEKEEPFAKETPEVTENTDPPKDILPTAFAPALNQSITLKNIFFESTKSVLLAPSFAELDKLLGFLNENPSTKIIISGHTDNTGNAQKNRLLSEARAKAVMDYLIAQGLDSQRITYKGYGCDKPLSPNTTEEGRQQNRRVEFVISGE